MGVHLYLLQLRAMSLFCRCKTLSLSCLSQLMQSCRLGVKISNWAVTQWLLARGRNQAWGCVASTTGLFELFLGLSSAAACVEDDDFPMRGTQKRRTTFSTALIRNGLGWFAFPPRLLAGPFIFACSFNASQHLSLCPMLCASLHQISSTNSWVS